MFGEKAFELIKQLDRSNDALPTYSKDLIADINAEITDLIEENQMDVHLNEQSRSSGELSTGMSYIPTIHVRHVAIQRNIRCLLAYHYKRLSALRTMRWEFGSTLPQDIRDNLSSSETEWYTKYSNNLAQYMRSIGDNGLNLFVDSKPPKSLYVEVRCLVDYGNFELNDGSILLLKKNSRHFLPRSECEELIKQGVFEHIVN